MTSTTPATPARRPDRRRWPVLAVMCVIVIVVYTDTLMAAIALPSLARDLDASTSALQWIVNSYTLVLAGLLIPGGAIADRIGRRRTLLGGLALFGIASAGAALAASSAALIAWRMLAGAAAALLAPATLGVLRSTYREAADLSRAIGVWSAASAAGIAAGPVLGGWLLDTFYWGSVYLVNVPGVVVALLLTICLVPESHRQTDATVSLVDMALIAGGLTSVTFGMVEAPTRGWTSAPTLTALAIGLTTIGVGVWRERRQVESLLPRALARSRQFLAGVGAGALTNFALVGSLFLLTQHLELVAGYTSLTVGTRLIPLVLAVAVGSLVSAALAARVGRKWPTAAALAVAAVGLGLLADALDVAPSYGAILAAMLVLGVGLGVAQAVTTDAIMSAAAERLGARAAAINDAALQFGAAFGVAVLGTVFNARYRAALDQADVTATLPDTARRLTTDSLAGALRAADALASADQPTTALALADAGRDAFVSGVGWSMAVGAVVTFVAAMIVTRFLPHRNSV